MRWIWVASLCFFVVVAVGRGLFGKTSADEAAELKARFPTKDSCLAGTAQRIAPCSSPSCYELGWKFLDSCLERADGDKQLFCGHVLADPPVDSRGRDIFTTHCQQSSPYETECEKIIERTGFYCSRII